MASRKRKPVRKQSGVPHGAPDSLPFTAGERDIFYFCDHGMQCKCKRGEKKCRRIDPMAVLDVLEDAGPQYEADMKILSAPTVEDMPEANQTMKDARKRVGELLRKAFKLAPLDDAQGVTWHECLAVMTEFSAFLERCKKKADALRTSLGLAPPPSLPRTLSPTKPASASNSTSAACTPSNPSTPPPASDSSSEVTPAKTSGDALQAAM